MPAEQSEFSLRQSDGSPVGLISRGELEILIEDQMVCGRVRGRRLKWLELTVPLGAARRALGDSSKSSVRSQASQTSVKVRVDVTRTWLWQHHRGRCLAWTATRAAQNS